jgi:hypothetical protein
MTGATALAAGTAGTVPAPAAGSQNSVFSGGGTYLPITGQAGLTTIVTNGTSISIEAFDDINAVTPAANAAVAWNLNSGLFLDVQLNGTHALSTPTNLPAAGTYRIGMIRLKKTAASDALTAGAFYGSPTIAMGTGTADVILSVLITNTGATILQNSGGTSTPADNLGTGPTVNNNWTVAQTATPAATAAEATLNRDGSAYQTTTLTAARTLAFTGTAKPGTVYRLEVTHGGFPLTIPAANDPGAAWSQPTHSPIILGFETTSAGVVRFTGVV